MGNCCITELRLYSEVTQRGETVVGGREAQECWLYTCILTADSHGHTAETNRNCKAIKLQLKIKQNSGEINLERLNWFVNPCITIRTGAADRNKTPFAIKKKERKFRGNYVLQRGIELSITMLYLVCYHWKMSCKIQVDPYVKWGLFL